MSKKFYIPEEKQREFGLMWRNKDSRYLWEIHYFLWFRFLGELIEIVKSQEDILENIKAWEERQDMPYVAVDDTDGYDDEIEGIFSHKPARYMEDENVMGHWIEKPTTEWISLPKGSIKKLIGRELTWEDEPVELRGEE